MFEIRGLLAWLLHEPLRRSESFRRWVLQRKSATANGSGAARGKLSVAFKFRLIIIAGHRIAV